MLRLCITDYYDMFSKFRFKVLFIVFCLLIFSTITPAIGATLKINILSLPQYPLFIFLESKNDLSIAHVQSSLLSPLLRAKITSTMMRFEPSLQILPVGTVLEVNNEDAVLHNTHLFDHDKTLFNVATPNGAATAHRTLSRPGLFRVRCDVHSNMKAWIAVFNNSYYSLIEFPGLYQIESIEPGAYKVHIQMPDHQEIVFDIELSSAEIREIQLPLDP